MKTVKVYIETTITGPSKPKYGKYAAALAFTRKNGKTEDRFLQGSEQETTYNRSVLLAMVRAMQRFTEPCHIIFYTRNTFIPNMIRADNPEKWRRAEWRKSDGKDIQNKGFGYAKLALMLTLPESVAEELTPAYSKSEIQAVKEEIESEEKITDIEVILEGEKEEQKELDNLEKAIHQICMDEPELYLKLHEAVRTSIGTGRIKEVLAPDGDKLYSVRPQGCGRIMLYLNDEKDEVILQVVRQGLKEKYAWENILSYLVLITEEEDAKQNWEELYRQKYPEKERIAPVQPKKEKRKESKVVKAKLPKQKNRRNRRRRNR